MKRVRAFGFWLLLAALLALAAWLETRMSFSEEIHAGNGESVHVIDGDSFRIGDREVRLAGVDAPDYRQLCWNQAGHTWPCGKEARTALVQLMGGGALACTKAAEDRYGRSLAHCRAKGGDLGTSVARGGWALAARDERFAAPTAAIAEARANRRGMWRGRHEHPADWRKANR